MRRRFLFFLFPALPCLLALLLSSCVKGQLFTSYSTYEAPLSGPYTFLLYTGVYEAQTGKVIIMYPERGAYTFRPYVPARYGWQTIEGVPGDAAMSEAGRILRVKDIRTLRVQAIMHEGNPVGYQVSPPTKPPGYDISSYYEISYFLTKGKVVDVQILPSPTYRGY